MNNIKINSIRYKVEPVAGEKYRDRIELTGKVLIQCFNEHLRPLMEVEIMQGEEFKEGKTTIILLNLPDEKVAFLRKVFSYAVWQGNNPSANN